MTDLSHSRLVESGSIEGRHAMFAACTRRSDSFSSPRVDSSDQQLAAIESVARRAGSVTRWIATVIVVPAILLIFPMYFVARELQFALIGVHLTYVSGGLAVVTTLGPAIAIARVACRVAVRSRRKAWIEQAALQHSVSSDSIAEFFGEWNAG
jgi:hypothetical protein